MMIHCPNCHSTRIDTIDAAKKTCGYLGMAGGAMTTTTSALGGAELGGSLGLFVGPPGIAMGGVAGAILSTLVGIATGGVAGAKLGEIIDERILDNYQCLACDYSFAQRLGN